MTKELFEAFMFGYLMGIITPFILKIIDEIKLMFKEW